MPARSRATAVVYHYFEKDDDYRDNFVFFLSRAVCDDHDFFVLISGDVGVDLVQHPLIRYMRVPDFGQDFGAIAQLVNDGALDGYDRLVFVNCTVRGPFLPPYVRQPWTEPFVSLLHGDVHLVGATINILHDDRPFHQRYEAAYPGDPKPYSHVQSSVHAMTGACLAMLRGAGIYADAPRLSKEDAVVQCEIAMSQRVKAAGWNLSCLLPAYRGIDYRGPHREINPTTPNGHPQGAGHYFGQSLHPYESLFVKTGWGGLTRSALDFHTLMALRHHPVPGLDWREGTALAARVAARLDGENGARATD